MRKASIACRPPACKALWTSAAAVPESALWFGFLVGNLSWRQRVRRRHRNRGKPAI